MICALYKFQDRFDTSFTMLRHIGGLLEIGFEEPTPERGLLPDVAPDWSLSELALRSAKLSPGRQLTLDWYACLVSRYLDFEFGDEFLSSISSLEEDGFLRELRELAITCGFSAYRKSTEALFHLPSWAGAQSNFGSNDRDRFHICRYLLDPKVNLAKIRKAYDKDRKASSPEPLKSTSEELLQTRC